MSTPLSGIRKHQMRGREIITSSDIEAIASRGLTTMSVGSNGIVTHEALERALKLQIQLVRPDSEGISALVASGLEPTRSKGYSGKSVDPGIIGAIIAVLQEMGMQRPTEEAVRLIARRVVGALSKSTI